MQETLTSKIVELQRCKSELHILRTKAQDAQQKAAAAADRSASDLQEAKRRATTGEAALEKSRQEAEALRTRLKATEMSLEERDAAMLEYKEKVRLLSKHRYLEIHQAETSPSSR